MPGSKLAKANDFNHVANLTVGRNNLVNLAEAMLEPLVLSVTVLCLSVYYEREITLAYVVLAILVFSMTFPGKNQVQDSISRCIGSTLISWSLIATLILLFGYGTRSLGLFHHQAIVSLLWIPPAMQLLSHLAFRQLAPWLLKIQGSRRKAIIVGMNEQGVELAERITASPYANIDFLGFFDDRPPERTAQNSRWPVIGNMSELAKFAKAERLQLIYLSLPMATQPRILSILDDLRDTTASVYFVPDLFVTDLIQGRMDHVCDMPVVSVCETPFTGTHGLLKRCSDVVIALGILCLISPLLLIIALAVKLTSPGPIIFKQRRYGLNGEEIMVYKFRSMTVCEDGASIQQAQKNDKRVTRIGGFLRKSSLDELPQFINVLQGRMSIVGPRPHAVAHNELYRGLIKGYMVRHKVKPGITGWAQVNGLRGETDTLDKMQARIEHDLDYLRHWSLGLDIKIILMTVGVVFKDQYAY